MPNCLITFAGTPSTRPVVRANLVKGFGKHSVCVVDLAYGRSLSRSAADVICAPEWTPAVVDLSNGSGNAERWFSYVHTAAVVSDNRDNSGSGSVIRYTLMGTSLPMNQQRTRSWSHITDSGVVRAIAREHRMRSIVQRTPEILPYVAQSGDSDWRVLKARADRNGYRLYVDGSTLLFADPTLLLAGTRTANIQSYTQNAINGSPDSLVKWNASGGSMSPGSSTGRNVAYGLDQRTRRVVTASATNDLGAVGVPVLTKIGTSARLGGTAQATQAVNATALAARGWNTAVATVSGSPGKQPGDVVNIQGANIPAEQRGLWLVTEVSHRLINDNSSPGWPFLTDLSLERDKIYAPTFNTAYRTINTRDSVNAIMRNGAFWEAETLEDVRVG